MPPSEENNRTNTRGRGSNPNEVPPAVNNIVSTLQNNFKNFQSSINNSISLINTKIESNRQLLTATQSVQNTIQQSITNNQTQLTNSLNQIATIRNDLTTSLNTINQNNTQTNLAILNISEQISAGLAQQAAFEQERAKDARLTAEQNRKRNNEGILEASGKAINKTGRALSSSTSGLLGGFNLLNALRGLLGGLALGFAIQNWDSILNGLESNLESIKRIGGLWGKQVLRPIARFFADLVGLPFKIAGGLFSFFRRAGDAASYVIRGTIGLAGDFLNQLKRIGGNLLEWLSNTPAGRAFASTIGVVGDFARQGVNVVGEGAATTVENFANGTRSFFSEQIKNLGNLADTLTGGRASQAAQAGMEFYESTKKTFMDGLSNTLEKVDNFFRPVTSKVQGAINALKTAAKNGPDALRSTASRVITPLQNTLGAALNSVLNNFPGLGGLINRAGGLFGVDTIKKLGRGGVLTAFPIDFLLNKYFFGQDNNEALTRAVFSALGSGLGGAVLGAGTGGFGAFAGGVIGGEAGDYLAAKLFGYDFDGNLVNSAQKLIDAYFNGELSNGGEEGDKNAKAMTPVLTPMASMPMGRASTTVDRMNGNGSVHSPTPDVQISAPAQEDNDQKISQMLRRPGTEKSGSSIGGKGGLTNITLPASQMTLPAQTAGAGGGLNQKEANPLPSISSSNPYMAFYEMQSASQYEVQLV